MVHVCFRKEVKQDFIFALDSIVDNHKEAANLKKRRQVDGQGFALLAVLYL